MHTIEMWSYGCDSAAFSTDCFNWDASHVINAGKERNLTCVQFDILLFMKTVPLYDIIYVYHQCDVAVWDSDWAILTSLAFMPCPTIVSYSTSEGRWDTHDDMRSNTVPFLGISDLYKLVVAAMNPSSVCFTSLGNAAVIEFMSAHALGTILLIDCIGLTVIFKVIHALLAWQNQLHFWFRALRRSAQDKILYLTQHMQDLKGRLLK